MSCYTDCSKNFITGKSSTSADSSVCSTDPLTYKNNLHSSMSCYTDCSKNFITGKSSTSADSSA